MTEIQNKMGGNEVATAHEARSMGDVMAKVRSLNDGNVSIYSTVEGNDFNAQKATLNAITNSEAIVDHTGKKIMLKNFVIQASTMIDDETGEERDILRTILIAADGKAYHAVSDGLFKALQNFTAILGHPSTWPDEGVGVVAQEIKGRRGFRFLTIKLA